MNDTGPSFEEFFGEALSSLDNMIDRSPVGSLEVAGGVLRYSTTATGRCWSKTRPTPAIR